MSERHVCSGLLADGSTCPICWPIGMDQSKEALAHRIRGEVRTNEDFIEPEPVFVPTGSLK